MSRTTFTIATLGVIIAFSIIIMYYTQTQALNTEIGYGDITVEQAKSLIEMKPSLRILDVRTREEYNNGHIEKAILIPVDELRGRLDEVSKNYEILVYCRTGNRSSNAVNILQTNGFTKIFNMKNGINSWIQAGYPTLL